MTRSETTRSASMARGAQPRGAACRFATAMLASLLVVPASHAQQSLAQRIAGVHGEAELRFASRPDVCGNAEGGISFHSSTRMRSATLDERDGWSYRCERGPVRVRLSVADGAVTRVRTYVGERHDTATGVADLGVVGTHEAVDYFLDLAREAATPVARKAITPAALADSVAVSPRLIELARDRARPTDVRKPALFWAGQLGGDEVLEPARAMANDASEDESMRKHATFVLSQLPDGAGLPALMELARNGEAMPVRKQALFWAGQGGAPTAELLEMYRQLDERDLKKQMIFVLSQRDDSAATDGLIQIARGDADHSLRKQAFFWLGQKHDPRVVELLTSILEK